MKPPTISIFFSYAHADAEVDPSLIRLFAEKLPKLVKQRVPGANVEVWYDEKLKPGYVWKKEMLDRAREAHIFLFPFTGHWIDSEYCRMEYDAFRSINFQVASTITDVFPIYYVKVEKPFDTTGTLTNLYDEIRTTQFVSPAKRNNAKAYCELSEKGKNALLLETAKNIVGVAERVAHKIRQDSELERATKLTTKYIEKPCDEDYLTIDLVTECEAKIVKEESYYSIRAQANLLPCVYLRTDDFEIEFGIQNALIDIKSSGRSNVKKSNLLDAHKQCKYVKRHAGDSDLTISIKPLHSEPTIVGLMLPQNVRNENFFSEIATSENDINIADVEITLSYKLHCGRGLKLFENSKIKADISNKEKSMIEAIIRKAAMKFRNLSDRAEVTHLFRMNAE